MTPRERFDELGGEVIVTQIHPETKLRSSAMTYVVATLYDDSDSAAIRKRLAEVDAAEVTPIADKLIGPILARFDRRKAVA